MKLFVVRPSTLATVWFAGWPQRPDPVTLADGFEANRGVALRSGDSSGWWFDQYRLRDTVIRQDLVPQPVQVLLEADARLRECSVQDDGHEDPPAAAWLVIPHRSLRDREIGPEIVTVRGDLRTGARVVFSSELPTEEAIFDAGLDGLALWCDPSNSELYAAFSALPAAEIRPFDGFTLPDDRELLDALPDRVDPVGSGLAAEALARQGDERTAASGRTTLLRAESSLDLVIVEAVTSRQRWMLRALRSSTGWLADCQWGDPSQATDPRQPVSADLACAPYVAPTSGALDLAVVGFAPDGYRSAQTVRSNGEESAQRTVHRLPGIGFGWFCVPVRHDDVSTLRLNGRGMPSLETSIVRP